MKKNRRISATYITAEAHLRRVDEHVQLDAGRLPLHRLNRPQLVVEGAEDAPKLGHPHAFHAARKEEGEEK